jgi:HPt (histidine-containing phosphotransfer) domain-containing protein
MYMPNLGGLEATELLRKEGVSIPIVVLTASAMTSDIERCRGAGCDAHVSKPIDRQSLFQTLRRYLPSDALPVSGHQGDNQRELPAIGANETSAEHNHQFESSNELSENAPIDMGKLNVKLGGDEELSRAVIDAFMSDSYQRVALLEEAVGQDSREDIRFISHALKGSAATICAARLADAANRLETAAAKSRLGDSKELFAGIRDEFEKIKSFLERRGWIGEDVSERVLSNMTA